MTNIAPVDTTDIQMQSLEIVMCSLGYNYCQFYKIFYHENNKAARTISFHTAVLLYNCSWIRVSQYEWVPDFHFKPNTANKTPFRLTSYERNNFEAAKIVESVHLQKMKNGVIRPTKHWVKFVDEDYYANLWDQGAFNANV